MTIRRLFALPLVAAVLLAVAPIAGAAGPTGTWASGIACVNMGAATTPSINLTFYTSTGAVALDFVDSAPLAAGASRNYYTPSSPPGLPSGFSGSAVVTSDQLLACNVNTQTTGSGTAASPYRLDTSHGVAATESAPTIFVPQVMKKQGGTWSSYVSVQNTDSAQAASVTIFYKDRNGVDLPAASETASIPASSSKIFYQDDNASLPTGFLGSAKIVSNGANGLAGVVAMYNAGTNNTDAQMLTYNAVGTGAARLLAPRVVRNYYGYNSGVSVQNVGATPTNVTVNFSFGGVIYPKTIFGLPPGAAAAMYTPTLAELNVVDTLGVSQRFGSAEILAPGGSVVAIVNEDNRGGAGVPVERVGQGATYNALADGSQTNTVFFAQVVRKAGSVYSGGIQVANTTATPTTCTITYSGYPGATEVGVPLAANGSIMRFAPNVSGLPDGFNSSVSVTCGQPVVGISNLAVIVGSGRLGDSFAQPTGINK